MQTLVFVWGCRDILRLVKGHADSMELAPSSDGAPYRMIGRTCDLCNACPVKLLFGFLVDATGLGPVTFFTPSPMVDNTGLEPVTSAM